MLIRYLGEREGMGTVSVDGNITLVQPYGEETCEEAARRWVRAVYADTTEPIETPATLADEIRAADTVAKIRAVLVKLVNL